jgi:hypothetical protein
MAFFIVTAVKTSKLPSFMKHYKHRKHLKRIYFYWKDLIHLSQLLCITFISTQHYYQ